MNIIISPLIGFSCIVYFFIIIAMASADERSNFYNPASNLQNTNPNVLPRVRQRADEIERPDHRCGPTRGGCREGRCCSSHGWCGDTAEYCREKRVPRVDQTLHGWTSSGDNAGVSAIVSRSLFDSMFEHRKDCPSRGFYSYAAFLAAAASFPGFGTTGDLVTRKRELAAFFGQTSQATSGERRGSYSDHSWGYCQIKKTLKSSEYCTSRYWPCFHSYHARGPIQLTHNYNYGLAGKALGLDLLSNPELVETDPVVSFKTAIWFWMTHHDDKPACHDIVIQANLFSGRYRYGDIGSIIRGESPSFVSNEVTNSVGYYKRYCDMLGVSYGGKFMSWYDSNQGEYTKPALVDLRHDPMLLQVVEEISS